MPSKLVFDQRSSPCFPIRARPRSAGSGEDGECFAAWRSLRLNLFRPMFGRRSSFVWVMFALTEAECKGVWLDSGGNSSAATTYPEARAHDDGTWFRTLRRCPSAHASNCLHLCPQRPHCLALRRRWDTTSGHCSLGTSLTRFSITEASVRRRTKCLPRRPRGGWRSKRAPSKC